MLKDIVVNLTGGGPQDFAVNYAISVAREFGAQLTGIAFVFDPVIPDAGLGGVSPSLIEMQRDENTKAAQDAVDRFTAAAKSAGVVRRGPLARCQSRRGDQRIRPDCTALRHCRSSASRSATTARPRN